jgi:hypothetical protein
MQVQGSSVARLLMGGILLLLISDPSHAQESVSDDQPVAPSVTQEPVTIRAMVGERIRTGQLFPYFEEKLADLPPFIRDLKIGWNTRSYDFNRDRFSSGRSEAFALGGALHVRTGWLADHFAVAGTLFTSQKLIGKESRDGPL